MVMLRVFVDDNHPSTGMLLDFFYRMMSFMQVANLSEGQISGMQSTRTCWTVCNPYSVRVGAALTLVAAAETAQ